jgi:hydrogenase-4 component B
MLLVFGAANGFAFLLAWEAMTVTSAILVFGMAPGPERIRSGYIYLAATHVAAAGLLVAFALLAGHAGSLAFADWAASGRSLDPFARDLVFVLLTIGFATKAGAVPFHSWLPRAHPVAPAHVSALMSGVMIKAGIYGLVRFGFEILGPGPDWWGLAILAIGAVSALLGILYALMEPDLKRLLAFSSIENVGIVLVGFGTALLLEAHGHASLAAVALVAALFHAFNHGLFKGLLFLAAGAVQHATTERDLNRLGGLARTMPVTFLLFGVGAVAISGLPPLNGFASEWLTFQALLLAAARTDLGAVIQTASLVALGVLALTVALALAAFVKATGTAFLALPRSADAGRAHEVGRTERAAMAVLAALCVAVGVGAAWVADFFRGVVPAGEAMAAAIPGALSVGSTGAPASTTSPLLLAGVLVLAAGAALAVSGLHRERIRRVATWTCGIAPRASMEYTATSYSKLIRLFFRAVLRPERRVIVQYHPGSSVARALRYEGSVTHLFDSHLYGPLHAASVRAAGLIRRAQNGSLQAYIAYTIGALALLLVLAR